MVKTFTSRRWVLVWQFTLAGALLGLLVGLCEAALLYFIPRVPMLQKSDVRYVIWFLAPLMDLSAFGLVGFAMGVVGAARKRPDARQTAILASAGVGAAGAYLAWLLDWIHVKVGVARFLNPQVATPVVWFVVVFVCTFVALHRGRSRVIAFFEASASRALKPLTMFLLGAAALLVSGLMFYAGVRSFPSGMGQARASQFTREPNIILIVLDTVRADHLSAYGYSRPTTPHLDQLASQGLLFENAVSASSWTLPSLASMFTGLLPHQHGASAAMALDPGPWTLAEVLKSQGYETAGFSSNTFYGLGGWGLAQGFHVYEDDSFSLRHNLAATRVGQVVVKSLHGSLFHRSDFDRRDAREVNRDVFRWFRRRSNRPFFLFINYFDAHQPYLPPPPYDRRFGEMFEDVPGRISSLGDGHLPKPFSSQEQASLIAGYDNSLAFLDEQVGQLVQFLSSAPEWPNTIIIITSDHGEGFGDHGTYDHGWNLYREVIHVPLILYGPGVPAGRRIAHLARTRELFPTVLDLALGEKVPFRRSSLRRFWTPGFQPEAFDEGAVAEVVVGVPRPDRPAFISLITPEWHYHQDAQRHVELHHWPTDPEEKNNLANLPQYQSTLQTLRARLDADVGHSLPPWRELEYVSPLNQHDSPFRKEIVSGNWPRPHLPDKDKPRVGISQSYFTPPPSPTRRRPLPADEDLIRSLPYH